MEHMREHGFNLGGEQSGHVILSDYSTTGDGLVAAMQVWRWSSAATADERVCHAFEPLPQMLENVRFKGGKPLEDDG